MTKIKIKTKDEQNLQCHSYMKKLLYLTYCYVMIKRMFATNLTFTITSTEKAVTANNHVDGECFVQSTVSKAIGATSRNRHTSKARACRFLKSMKQ